MTGPEASFEPLWAPEHPYYCNEATWYANDHSRMGDWETPRMDLDLNLVVRWDWERMTDDDGEPIGGPGSTLTLFVVLQRKGRLVSWEFDVKPDDEPSVRAYLERCWARLNQTWAPVSGWKPGDPDGD